MQVSSTRNMTPQKRLTQQAQVEQNVLIGKAKVGGTIGAALGLAAGLVGGIAGTLVGMAVAPATAALGAVAGGIDGFMVVANRENTHVGHLIGGVLAGAAGAFLLGSAGLHGGGLLGAAAGDGGGALGAIAGAIGGTTIGTAMGGLGVAGFELGANGEQYPNFLAELKKEAAEEAAQEKKNEAEAEKIKQELKQKLNDREG